MEFVRDNVLLDFAISSYHKDTNGSFSQTMKLLYEDGIINEKLID